MEGKVNKVKPVFSSEKGCIQKFSVLTRGIKYTIFHDKIQDLPYILYHDFPYDDESIWRRRRLKPNRRPASLKRVEGLFS